jgi:hypothetical protein
MKKLIITEEEKKHILSRHNSPMFLNEAKDADVIAIQTAVGVTADGSLGPKTISAILSKIGGKPSAEVTTPQTTTAPAVTTGATTTAPAVTTPETTTSPAVTTGTTFSAAPVAGATTLETACGNRKTNKDFRLCRKVFNKTAK